MQYRGKLEGPRKKCRCKRDQATVSRAGEGQRAAACFQTAHRCVAEEEAQVGAAVVPMGRRGRQQAAVACDSSVHGAGAATDTLLDGHHGRRIGRPEPGDGDGGAECGGGDAVHVVGIRAIY